MEQYLINEEEKLSPAVVVATIVLIAGFVVGFLYQLVSVLL
ncbi:MAG: hypothetical protein ACQETB_12260 [Halobacteriota archaeon]